MKNKRGKQNNQRQPDVVRQLYGKKGLVVLEARKIVTKFSSTAHVLLPKELIGKIVYITYKKEGQALK
jgi:putative transposon-encoded protein